MVEIAITLSLSYISFLQGMHIIQKINIMVYGPWYIVSEIQNKLPTPEWSFSSGDLKSF